MKSKRSLIINDIDVAPLGILFGVPALIYGWPIMFLFPRTGSAILNILIIPLSLLALFIIGAGLGILMFSIIQAPLNWYMKFAGGISVQYEVEGAVQPASTQDPVLDPNEVERREQLARQNKQIEYQQMLSRQKDSKTFGKF